MKYIKWSKKDSPSFEERYLEVTGEKVVSPMINIDGSFYLIGSSRLVPTHIDTLQGEFSIEVTDSFPSDWEFPVEEEE